MSQYITASVACSCNQPVCVHPKKRQFSSHVGELADVCKFLTLLKRDTKNRFPTLASNIPIKGVRKSQMPEVRAMIQELALLKKLNHLFVYALIDDDEREFLDGDPSQGWEDESEDGVILDVGKDGLMAKKDGRVLFQSKAFTQIIDTKAKFVDCKTGTTFIFKNPICYIPDEEDDIEDILYPDSLRLDSVQKRIAEYDHIIKSLEEIFQIATSAEQPICWK